MEHTPIMKDATKRSVLRWIHIACSIPIVGYIYSPFEQIPNYAPAVRFGFLPAMLVSGLWMWKGHMLRRLISKSAGIPRRDASTAASSDHAFGSREARS
jgi:thiosulfate reductase cytochrome b subunit